ncbi:Sensor histidine kinase RcsC [Sinobacterium norvegicum]|uniref:histidine kinase n=1 Tax=Sinobacterium norvegicum TaxID=1641715 RepID=A0ABM9AC47_9GAMM|nr:hybrid sensor histidine kinase/response regulator [Sinobacterium norvegicum]CAH0990770.1 Sensor histidine kinase RcsC [Sinobacterium norvegicum]
MSVYSQRLHSLLLLFTVAVSIAFFHTADAAAFNASYLIDPSGQLTIEQAVEQKNYTPLEGSALHAGYSPYSYWLKISPDEQHSFEQHFLVIDYAPLNNVQIFRPNSKGNYEAEQVGNSVAKNTLTPVTNFIVAPLNPYISPDQPLYLRVASSSSIDVPLNIVNWSQLIEQQNTNKLIYGIYFGLLLVMMCYNLFIYFSIKDTSYLLYVLYIASFTLMQASITGYAFQYLWPNHPALNNVATPMLVSLSCLFAALFSRSFLKTRHVVPIADKLMLAIAALSLLLAAASFFIPYHLSTPLGIVLILAFTLIAIASGIACYRKKVAIALFFLIGWCCILLGASVVGLTAVGILPGNWLTHSASQIGSAIEVFSLSLALAHRLNQLQREKEELERNATLKQKAINKELADTLKQLEISNKTKDNFLSTISHELRTPITGIAGSLAMIQREGLSTQASQYLESASVSTGKIKHHIDTLLNFSDIQAGHVQAHNQHFNLPQHLERLSKLYQLNAKAKGLTFQFEAMPTLPSWVVGDIAKIEIILQHLLDNAIKFSHKGNIKLQVTAAQNSQRIDFEISDGGCGISAEQAQTIFNPFIQSEAGFSRSYQGLGIGLTTSHQLAHLLEGELRYHSLQPSGSCFTLSLPLPRANFIDNQPQPTLAILVAEDNPVNLMIIKAQLQQLGHQVDSADNGQQAVNMAKVNAYDIIFMDCQMPVVDGYQATQVIKQSPLNAATPIIAVTANTMTRDIERCLAAGMEDILAKPIIFDQLPGKLQQWLSKSSRPQSEAV